MKLLKTLAVIAATAVAIPAANAAVLDLQTDAVTVNVGENFEVRLIVDREMADLIGGLDARLDFTTDTLAFVSGDVTNLGDTTGTEIVGLLNPGTVEAFALTNSDETTLSAEQDNMFSILSLTFQAIGAGRGEVELDEAFATLFGTDLFSIIQTRIADGDVNVLIDVQPVPLPGAALFLLTGLGGMVAARRRAS